tara:strand:+ start:1821 stop:2840 length:1020 start_codon:yes stop_codon:yes gene_type:complete
MSFTIDDMVSKYMNENESKSTSTAQTLKSSLIRLTKILDKDFKNIKVNDFKNTTKLLDLITENYSLNTTIQTILGTIKFLIFKDADENLIDDYRQILNELIQERNAQQGKQEFKEGEKDNWIDYPELKKKVEEFSIDYLDNKKSFTGFRNFLIVCLYVLMPPARIGNYLDMVKKDSSNMKRKAESLNKKNNYVVRNSENDFTFIFNKYKTSKNLGSIKYDVKSIILNKMLEKYFNDYNDNPKVKNFMINASGKAMTQVNFTNSQSSITKKLFNKKITNNVFRRIFFTHFLSTNPSVEDKIDVLKISGQNYKPAQIEKYDRSKKDGEDELGSFLNTQFNS